VNIDNYDQTLGSIRITVSQMEGCRDLAKILGLIDRLRTQSDEIEKAARENILDAKEVPRFTDQKCKCGEPQIQNSKFCPGCGKRYANPSGDASCG